MAFLYRSFESFRYPGATGGQAVAETLFGASNRFGKLPFTYYAYNFTQLVRGAQAVSTVCVTVCVVTVSSVITLF